MGGKVKGTKVMEAITFCSNGGRRLIFGNKARRLTFNNSNGPAFRHLFFPHTIRNVALIPLNSVGKNNRKHSIKHLASGFPLFKKGGCLLLLILSFDKK
ncbi:hypothetical protein GGTG_09171 [Gaeumannomyces tritici R3-111a-1]|uniref:Uncharacterized protein n=1 Tax=Gaeumannomyces tritici (strain R3-111a-1) TaxID=644352 RepID=J3P6M9_GAET3|nr:hypothetical protein GGTG_09171 [Gaeumannomyces tritici R3-111a-1]EJT72305.1 hypothetical protein GGTG_09171 [Gaeumannomyces tritici R3-111a-1]